MSASRRPYGLDELEGLGHRLLHANPYGWGSDAVGAELVRRVETRLDRRFGQVAASVALFRRSDVVLSLFEDFGRTYGRLIDLLAALPPLVIMSCWMAQRAMTDSDRQLRLYQQLGQQAALITVFSSNQADILRERLLVPADRIEVLDFGIDVEWYRPATKLSEPYVAAVGMDFGRDWRTLLGAASLLPDVRFRAVAPPERFAGLEVPGNVELLGTLDPTHYRDVVQQAAVAAVATYPVAYPSGQSVLLEAYACGTPAVATTSPALAAYLDPEAADSVPSGDPSALADALRRTIRDESRRESMARRAREIAEARFDQRIMWNVVAGLLTEVADAG